MFTKLIWYLRWNFILKSSAVYEIAITRFPWIFLDTYKHTHTYEFCEFSVGKIDSITHIRVSYFTGICFLARLPRFSRLSLAKFRCFFFYFSPFAFPGFSEFFIRFSCTRVGGGAFVRHFRRYLSHFGAVINWRQFYARSTFRPWHTLSAGFVLYVRFRIYFCVYMQIFWRS